MPKYANHDTFCFTRNPYSRFVSVVKWRIPKDVVLGSDVNGEACESFGVWVEKSMYGRKYMGIERTTFLISADGNIYKIWNKVKVKDHIEDVLKSSREMLQINS